MEDLLNIFWFGMLDISPETQNCYNLGQIIVVTVFLQTSWGPMKNSKTHKQLFNWSGLDRSQDVAEGRLFCVVPSFKPISIVLNPGITVIIGLSYLI